MSTTESIESKPSAEQILDKIEHLARISQVTHPGLRNYSDSRKLLKEIYDDLIPASKTPINNVTLRALATETYLGDNFEQILNAVSQRRFPGTDIPLFLRGGSYSLFNQSGVLTGFVEERVGEVYEGNAHNAAAFTCTKPAVLYALKAFGKTQDISDSDNTKLISRILQLPEGSVVHMGGIVVDLPKSKPGSLERQMVMGISSAELTPEAIQYMLDSFIARGAKDSIDPSTKDDPTFKDGHFTAAGFWDEAAGKVAAAKMNGLSDAELDAIIDQEWDRLRYLAINLHPLKPQFN